ncbi:MAG TPA: hypothetical protein VFN71_01555 [Methylomirabilota bacterium]|nr:hypothetical protein [Methylomirabilota bacterium]
MARFLYVVARDRLDLYDRLKEEFNREPEIEVIRDRRFGERRQNGTGHTPERRVGDRRRRRDMDMDLQSIGWFLTPLEDRIAWR